MWLGMIVNTGDQSLIFGKDHQTALISLKSYAYPGWMKDLWRQKYDFPNPMCLSVRGNEWKPMECTERLRFICEISK